MQFKSLHPNFQLPQKGSAAAGGFDIFMPTAGRIEHQIPLTVSLGFAAAVQPGFVALLLPRSGAGSRGLELYNTCGVIDADYRGEWKAVLRSKLGYFEWKAGDRILQFLLVPVSTVQPTLVDELPPTSRGEGGFGSTGA